MWGVVYFFKLILFHKCVLVFFNFHVVNIGGFGWELMKTVPGSNPSVTSGRTPVSNLYADY